MPIRKNKKRIDPRYFLHETTYRDLDESYRPSASGGRELLEKAVYKALVDGRHESKDNPLSLSALFDSSEGVARNLLEREFGIKGRQLDDAMTYRRELMTPNYSFAQPGGDGGKHVVLAHTSISTPGDTSAGEVGVYLVNASTVGM
tara:strand:- start:91 stop:528 length:438 start_codon:yes stop_codon:yes gene_type:complete